MTQQDFQKRYTYNLATDKLGEGGFGSVFKAYDNFRDRWVALKISKVNPEFETVRLRKEVDMVAKLPAHPNIAYYEECYTFQQMDGEYDFGILQYYEEGNLSQLLKNHQLTLEQKQSILTQILEGVDFLHNNGIIHRDLKPQNILMVKRGDAYIPKITDFGISKQLDINKSAVFDNSIAGAGTLSYSSPEQLADREIRKNTDLWSFGVIAFQVLAGQVPFNTGDHAVTSEAGRMEMFRQVNSGQLPDSISQIPEPWQAIIRQCLVMDVSARLKGAKEAIIILTGTYDVKIEHTAPATPTGGSSHSSNDNIEDIATQIASRTSKASSQSNEARVPSEPAAKKGLIIGTLIGAIILLVLWLFVTPFLERDEEQEPQAVEYQEEIVVTPDPVQPVRPQETRPAQSTQQQPVEQSRAIEQHVQPTQQPAQPPTEQPAPAPTPIPTPEPVVPEPETLQQELNRLMQDRRNRLREQD